MKPKKFITLATITLLTGVGAGCSAPQPGQAGTQQIPGQTQQQLSAEDQKTLDQLKKIILLPDNITPEMRVVTDAEALKKNEPVFFHDAQNGDVLVIYSDVAILYDPSANKILHIGPVQNSPTNSSTQQQAS